MKHLASAFERAANHAALGQWDECLALVRSAPTLPLFVAADGDTLLLRCARIPGSATVVRELIILGADVNHRARDGSNVLAAAIVGGTRIGLTTLPVLRLLLQSGADASSIADAGMPALHWSVAQARPEHAKVLLEHGADPCAVTSDDPPESAFDIARRMRSESMLALLQQYVRKSGGAL